MKADHPWQIFLESSGAEFIRIGEQQQLTRFSPPTTPAATAKDCQLTALTHVGMLQVAGPDSEKFLQGQLTCDVTQLTTAITGLGAACTPQGRVYSSFRLVKATDTPELSYLLRLNADNLERTRDTLGKYAVFYKTQLLDVRDQYVGIGIWGGDAAACLATVFDEIPETINEVVSTDNGWLMRVPGAEPRYECWLHEAGAETLWPKLAETAHCRAPDAWVLEDIRAGLAEISAATAEAFIPHMLNYQKVDAISFEKGCYTGQEIVARTEYRGKAKRGLFRLEIDTAEALAPGSELQSPTHSGTINVIASAAAGPDRQEALAVMATGLDDGATMELTLDNNTLPARILPLPQ